MKTKIENLINKYKLHLAIFILAVGVLIIAVSYIAVTTPLNINKPEATYRAIRTLPEPVLSVKEHICTATKGENCQVIYNLCKKESGTFIKGQEPCQQYSVNKNSNLTFDHSWFQINDVHIIGRPASKDKGTIKIDCVYDLYCASRWVNDKINAGYGHIWVAWSKI